MNKTYFYGLFTGLFIAVMGLLIWNKTSVKDVPMLAEKFEVEKNPEGVSQPKHSIKATRKAAVFNYEIPTKEYGTLRGEVQASRAALQYKHRIGVGGVILTDTVLARGSYAYKNVEFSLYYGYNFKLKEQRFGAGLGYAFSF